jgi:protein NirF
MLHLILALALSILPVSDKLYVVERERGSVAIIEDGQKTQAIEGLGDLSHATIKFRKDHAYVISRDGFLAKIDTSTDAVVKKVKVGESGIGLTFFEDLIVVANYNPGDVVILDGDLNILKRIETGSRNVGIKAAPPYLVFSLMDKDEIWVLDGAKDFELARRIEGAGNMPFDALLHKDLYLAGFFLEPGLGLLDLKTLTYRKIDIQGNGKEAVFKVPHFGTWGVWNGKALIPAVGERKIHLLDLEGFELNKSIELIGLPVFVVISPDGRHAVTNYSGEMEDFITVIDLEKMAVASNLRAGKRVMHMRFSEDSEALYLSSYYENRVKALSAGSWEITGEAASASPSGIFIVPARRGEGI